MRFVLHCRPTRSFGEAIHCSIKGLFDSRSPYPPGGVSSYPRQDYGLGDPGDLSTMSHRLMTFLNERLQDDPWHNCGNFGVFALLEACLRILVKTTVLVIRRSSTQ
jgi:hypothetical protein